MKFFNFLPVLLASVVPALAQNSTFYNPILPGWHSDPSCIQVNGTFFCVTSTFISFPGLPIYASKDLINWKHISHVWTRESQLPGYSWATRGQQEGMYAATIRYNKGSFYVICEYLGAGKNAGVLFKTTDPYSDSAWGNAVTFAADKIDPDIFWDDDGKVYVATQEVRIQEMDINTGKMGTPKNLWNGTGGVWPEGPHIYKKDGWYYLLIAEGGTAQDHAVTMARSKNILGPYTASPKNPHLTNRRTNEYFQTVGHADLFQDTKGNWWGTALATRSGPAFKSYPMGRETALFPVTWNTGDWPIMGPVRGKMNGWPLPPKTATSPEPDHSTTIPTPTLSPKASPFPATSPHPHPRPQRRNRRPGGSQPAAKAISFIGRRQTDSLFTYTVDLSFAPTAAKQEAGVTAFLTQYTNIQLGLTLANNQLSLRFNGTTAPKTTALPKEWAGQTVRLQIQMTTPTEYKFSAALAENVSASRIEVGSASAELLSGRTGTFVGTLLGVYATCNGAGSGLDCPSDAPKAYFNKWSYVGGGQYYSATEMVPKLGM
ncbi:glycosyl hydrolase [Phaeosphaeriaceae sp. PMI808]|nr:glycosyl hydrolase [Phaeosphaeriaceae sp. PMI808]